MRLSGNWLSDRLREPSTWKGLALVAGAFGVQVHPELVTQIGVAVGAVLGAIEVLRQEH